VSDHVHKFKPVKYENLRAAKAVLESPKRIFYGIRTYNEGGWCYTGRPTEWTVKERVTASFPDYLVFAVYVNPRLEVFEWRAEPVDDRDPYCPKGWEDRYRGLIWKSTS